MPGAAIALVAICAMIVLGGRALEPPPIALDTIDDSGLEALDAAQPETQPAGETDDAGAGDMLDAAAGPDEVAPAAEPAPASANPEPEAPGVTISSRLVAPAEVAPPPLQPSELERLPPREPLSPLAQARPPKPVSPDDWKGTTLFQPVATSAGAIEAKGHSIVVAGIDPVAPDETCEENGRSWPCGARARAAFRAMLRGRAVTCTIPPEAERAAIVAPCRVGKTDIGAWLVENGWARARADGPYADAGSAARDGRRGIFGAPPNTDVPAPSVTGSTLSAPPAPEAEPILAPETDAPGLAEPALPPVTEGLAFPPAPTAPASPQEP